MRRFTQTELWTLLTARIAGSRSAITPVPDAALDDFIGELHTYCREETNLAERTRTLQIAASELAAIRSSLPLYESGEKRAYSNGNRPGDGSHRL